MISKWLLDIIISLPCHHLCLEIQVQHAIKNAYKLVKQEAVVGQHDKDLRIIHRGSYQYYFLIGGSGIVVCSGPIGCGHFCRQQKMTQRDR